MNKNFSIRNFPLLFLSFFSFLVVSFPQQSFAFPIYAQQAYENPREANGRIVCANCHLAQKPTEIETPASVLPDNVFEAIVKIPYDTTKKQIGTTGQREGLNVGAIVILPEGFKLAPKNRLEKEILAKTKGVYITPYSKTRENILVVGPINGEKNQEILFPLLSPDPEKDKKVFYVKYPIYVGANRGRGQVYPTGEKTNNNLFNSTATGKIESIKLEKDYQITIATASGELKTQVIPKGLELLVKENQIVQVDQPLTLNPNVGGFGQTETEIVLQDPFRIYGFLAFSFSVIISQSFLVFKKKQFEKVQAAELDF
jgi:apocytochrome f